MAMVPAALTAAAVAALTALLLWHLRRGCRAAGDLEPEPRTTEELDFTLPPTSLTWLHALRPRPPLELTARPAHIRARRRA